MSYVLIEQNLEEEDEPRFIYAELDSGRREVRRVEFYPDSFHTAGSACRGCSSASGPAPQPAYRPPAFSSSSARRPFAVNRTA